MSSQPHHGGSKESCGKSHKKQSKVVWKTITILKMSTGYLVLELGDPFVSRDGCCPEDLNNSRSFGVAEGVTTPVPDLGKDRTKHDPARVVVWSGLRLGDHNGGSLLLGWWAPES